VDQNGLVKQGAFLVSPGFERADAKLLIDVGAALGSVEIDRIR
jgi:hypothetical protein